MYDTNKRLQSRSSRDSSSNNNKALVGCTTCRKRVPPESFAVVVAVVVFATTGTLVVVLTNKRADCQQCESYLGQITLDKLFNFRVTTTQRRIEKRNSGNAEGEHEKGTEEERMMKRIGINKKVSV